MTKCTHIFKMEKAGHYFCVKCKHAVSVKQLKSEHTKNYDKMIMWAKTQPLNNPPRHKLMERQIGLDWKNYKYDVFCKHYNSFIGYLGMICNRCPLRGDIVSDDGYKIVEQIGCCKGLWLNMEEAKTWKDWLKYARKIKKMIKSIPDKYIEPKEAVC